MVERDGGTAVQGLRIDRYVVIEQLGKGGMGVVYKAYDTKLERAVALKVIRGGDRGAKKARMGHLLMVREAQALAQLSHPNVISVHDVGTIDDNVFITMELAEGQTLHQWVQDKKPSREEILKVMVAAGQGLEAAHNAGLIHRDFKPSNVIVGRDGVVRVIDFGLARAPTLREDSGSYGSGSRSHDREPQSEEDSGTQYAPLGRACSQPLVPEIREEQEPAGDGTLEWSAGDDSGDSTGTGRRLLHTPLTRVGSVVGTPLYMAPEQSETIHVDARADQYSFCVVLFELLYRTVPFKRESLSELRRVVGHDSVDLLRPDGDVPEWLRRVVERGLSSKPEKRFESMGQLLDGLTSDPELVTKKRRAARMRAAFFGAMAVLLFSAPAAVWYEYGVRRSELCQGGQEQIASVWNPAMQTKIQAALIATGLPYAKGAAERAAQFFDDYAGQWDKMYTDACRATQVRGVQSTEVLDLRMTCLKRRFVEMRAMIDILGETDAQVAERASTALASLTPIEACADVEALQAPQRDVEPPKDEETARRVEEIREKLGEVRVLQDTGKFEKGLEHARRLKNEASVIAYLPLQAEVEVQLGRLFSVVGEYQTAEATHYEALRMARESKAGVAAAEAIADLVWVVGYRQGRYDAGLAFGRTGEAMFAVTSAANDRHRIRLFNNMGVVFDEQGRYDEALEYYRKAGQLAEKVQGSEHPSYGATLNNMGLAFYAQGNYQQALEYLLLDLRISEKALGREHPDIAATLNNIGLAYAALGELDEALSYYRTALAVRKATLGPVHAEIARALTNIASVLADKGAYDEALEKHQMALAIVEKTFGKDSPEFAFPLEDIAWIFTQRGENERALQTYERALAIREKALRPSHPSLAGTLCGIGRVLLAQGRHGEAGAPLERALAICRKETCEQWVQGLALFTLARAIVLAPGNKSRALTLAEAARAIYGKTPKAYEEDLAEIDEWLRKRSGN